MKTPAGKKEKTRKTRLTSSTSLTSLTSLTSSTSPTSLSLLFLAAFLFFLGNAPAQDCADVNRLLSFATVLDGDTIPLVHLKPVIVAAKWSLLTEKEIKKNQKLIRNVKKTLPYAKETRRRLQDLEKEMAGMSPKRRNEYIKQVEQDLLEEFWDDLEKLTISQGKVLLKLVDRETGNSSFNLVADLRGKFRASFYNTFAKVVGFNLKERYDPKHNKYDNLIERIARSVELGKL